MSDVRIERVEPCGEHGDGCYAGVQRKVLDGFPPEAVEATARALYDIDCIYLSPLSPKWEQEVEPVQDEYREQAEAALAAAWSVLVGEVSE